MGLMDWFIKARRAGDPLAGMDLGTTSPWKPSGALSPIVTGDLFPDLPEDRFPLSREEAMKIPGVIKLRNLLVASISPMPLVALKKLASDRVEDQPSFLYRTNALQSPEARTAATVDDLFFYGCSLWITDRGAGDSPKGGPILSAAWVPRNEWKIEQDASGSLVVSVLGVVMKESEYLLFDVPLYDGMLHLASRSMRGARAIEDAWVSRAKNPVPLLALKIISPDLAPELDQDAIDAIAASWTVRKNSTTSTVGVLPYGLDLDAIGMGETSLFESARNAMRGDIGAYAQVNAAMLDSNFGTDSMTYDTKEAEHSIFTALSLPFWTTPITSRLSMDDVVPSTQRVRFDKSELTEATTPPTGIPTED